jgi:hypothetical protein
LKKFKYEFDGAKVSAGKASALHYWVNDLKTCVVDAKGNIYQPSPLLRASAPQHQRPRAGKPEIKKPLKRISGFLT